MLDESSEVYRVSGFCSRRESYLEGRVSFGSVIRGAEDRCKLGPGLQVSDDSTTRCAIPAISDQDLQRIQLRDYNGFGSGFATNSVPELYRYQCRDRHVTSGRREAVEVDQFGPRSARISGKEREGRFSRCSSADDLPRFTPCLLQGPSRKACALFRTLLSGTEPPLSVPCRGVGPMSRAARPLDRIGRTPGMSGETGPDGAGSS